MIQPLRVVHRAIFPTLALALAVIVIAALVARKSGGSPASPAEVITGVAQTSSRHTVQFRLEGSTLLVFARGELEYPELLTYWSPDANAVSAGAVLLGAFTPGVINRYKLPRMNGILVFYAPATRTIVDSAPLGGTQ